MCVQDSVSPRLLPNKLDVPSLTPDKCKNACKENGFGFAGVQWKKECWCGTEAPPQDKIVEEVQCNLPCQGDSSKICGGSAKMNVYKSEGIIVSFNFNSKMTQFIQKCKEKIFPLVRGGGGKRGLTRGLRRGLRRSLVKFF